MLAELPHLALDLDVMWFKIKIHFFLYYHFSARLTPLEDLVILKNMTTFIAVCLSLITVELGIIAACLVVALSQIGRVTKSLELVCYRLEEKIGQVESILKSGWTRALGATTSFISGLWSSSKE